jgi:spore coat polysaccharide biosynthesis protein SpsF
MNSKRLSGKAMLDILDKPILWHIYNRLKACTHLDSVVISTGEYVNNKPICEFALKNNIPLYEGSELDLIDRIYRTALHFNSSAVVRITADCPLIDPKVIDKIITEYVNKSDQYDIVTNWSKMRTFPHGLDAEIYSIGALKKMWEEIKQPELREWFPLYYTEKNPALFRIFTITNPTNLSNLRWAMDYPEDYEFIKQIYQILYKETTVFGMEDVLDLIKKQPSLTEINSKYSGHHNVDAPNV